MMNKILENVLSEGEIKDISVYDYDDRIEVSLTINKHHYIEMMKRPTTMNGDENE